MSGKTPRYAVRPATHADADLLYRLHEATMWRYVEAVWGWEDAKQRAYFAAHFDPAWTFVVMAGGEDVGAITVDWRDDALFIGNIEVLPEWQGRGIGTAMLEEAISAAERRGLPVALRVLKINDAARRLYERLGFIVEGETATHHRMRRPVTR